MRHAECVPLHVRRDAWRGKLSASSGVRTGYDKTFHITWTNKPTGFSLVGTFCSRLCDTKRIIPGLPKRPSELKLYDATTHSDCVDDLHQIVVDYMWGLVHEKHFSLWSFRTKWPVAARILSAGKETQVRQPFLSSKLNDCDVSPRSCRGNWLTRLTLIFGELRTKSQILSANYLRFPDRIIRVIPKEMRFSNASLPLQ